MHASLVHLTIFSEGHVLILKLNNGVFLCFLTPYPSFLSTSVSHVDSTTIFHTPALETFSFDDIFFTVLEIEKSLDRVPISDRVFFDVAIEDYLHFHLKHCHWLVLLNSLGVKKRVTLSVEGHKFSSKNRNVSNSE